MSKTRARLRKATSLLREDHQAVKKLFARYEEMEDAGQDDKAELFRELKKLLTVHAQVEEEIFYPAIEGAEDDEAAEMVREAHEEHKIVKTLLAELSELTPAEEDFDAKMKVLKENVEHHAEEEQKDIFPVFDKLDKEEQDGISEQLFARKRELEEEATGNP